MFRKRYRSVDPSEGRKSLPRFPTGDVNAALAVQLFDQIMEQNGWGLDRAWLAIAKLLWSCQVWRDQGWRDLEFMPPGTPVLMESNNYKLTRTGEPNSYMQNAIDVRNHISEILEVPPEALCDELGVYFRHRQVSDKQPNNIRGHAFRSLVANTLATYGDQELAIREEHNARDLFPGIPMGTRSQAPKIDITVSRNGLLVAIVSSRWTYRHDRVDMLDEAHSYVPPARRQNPRFGFYGVTAEFAEARLAKVIEQSEPEEPQGIVRRLVHLHSPLPTVVVGHNGILANMMDLAEFVRDSVNWH